MLAPDLPHFGEAGGAQCTGVELEISRPQWRPPVHSAVAFREQLREACLGPGGGPERCPMFAVRRRDRSLTAAAVGSLCKTPGTRVAARDDVRGQEYSSRQQ